MLAIRLQRTGRKGHAQYKVIAQDSRFSPKSGKVVSYIGDYNPHTKQAKIDKESAEKYLQNGAQPSDRAATILKEAGVKLPEWYKPSPKQKKSIRNPEKLRKNRPEGELAPAEPEPAEDTETPAEEPAAESTPSEASQAPEAATEPEAEAKVEEPVAEAAETPADEPAETPEK